MGSDLDVIVILEEVERPFIKRAAEFDFTKLPVHAEILVYTREEWEDLAQEEGRFYQTVRDEAIWIYQRNRRGMAEKTE